MSRTPDKANSLVHGTLVILAASMLAKIASFITEAILAAYLGTSDVGDAYYMVSGIHQVLYPMLSVGIWKVFLPEYKKTLALKGAEEADLLANRVCVVFVTASLLFAALLAALADPLVAVVAPGFSAQTKILCSQLVRITAPMYIFIIASAVYAAMLQCHGKFFASQIREICTHIPTIVCALALFGRFGVYALAAGLVVGSMVRLLVELPFLNWGYRFSLHNRANKQQLQRLYAQIPAALGASCADQVNILVNKIIASLQAVGAVSALNYASKLQNVFLGLFSAAVTTASYPRIAEYVAQGKTAQLNSLVEKMLVLIACFLVPVSLGSALFAPSLVSVLFERGAFDAAASAYTARIYCCYAIGMVFAAAFALFNNIFYALNDAPSALRASVLCMAANVLLSIVLSWILGAPGLALAASISFAVSCAYQATRLRRRLFLHIRSLADEWGKIAGCSCICCLGAFLAALPFKGALLRLSVALVTGTALYFFTLWACKSTSFAYLRTLLLRKTTHK